MNLGLFIASTEGKTDRQFEIEFQWIEGITCVLYLIDYGLKIWSIVEAKHHHDPLWGRIQYVISPCLIAEHTPAISLASMVS